MLNRQNTSPDYIGLASFLLQPFLDDPQSLSIDCERIENKRKIWLRVAFDVADKGRILGRGGRNIQAIRTILETAATNVNESIHLDVFGYCEQLSKEKIISQSGSRRDREFYPNSRVKTNRVRKKLTRKRIRKPTLDR